MSFTTTEFADRRPRRWLWPAVAVAVAVALAVVLLIVVLTTGGGGGGESAAVTPPGGSTAEPNPSTGTGTGGNSGIPAVPNPATSGMRQPSDPQYLTAAPAGVNFQVVHGLQLPFSPVDGPLRVDGPVAAGYSHTPQGAALAAVQIPLRSLWAPGYDRVITEQAAIAPSLREQFLTYRNSRPQASDTELETAVARTVGFKVESYTPDRAAISIAFPNVNGAPGTYSTARYVVVWSDGDWKFADNSSSDAVVVNALTGYTTW